MYLSVDQGVFDDIDVRLIPVAGSQYISEMQLPNGSIYTDVLTQPTDDQCRIWGEMDDPREYGTALFDWLFPESSPRGADSLRAGLMRARWDSESMQERSLHPAGKIRFRLSLDPRSRKLHKLWWEAMYDPTRSAECSLQMAMSRLVNTGIGRMWPVSEQKLRILVVTSNPSGLDQYDCKPVDETFEKELLAQALAPVGSRLEFETMATPSVSALASRIRVTPEPHMIYVLAHSIYDEKGEGSMLFCGPDGAAEPVPFMEMVRVLAPERGGHAPRLVFLAVPLSAKVDYDNTLATLGPAIVSAGVQSVIAVHAPYPTEMLLAFSEALFQHLVLRGEPIEKATMLARAAVFRPGHWGWAYPVLYLGTPDGTLFQPLLADVEPSFADVASKLRPKA